MLRVLIIFILFNFNHAYAKKAIFKTTLGNFTVDLFSKENPDSSKLFEKVVKSGFYKGIIFHKVLKNFVAQSGVFDKSFNIKKNKIKGIKLKKNSIKNEKGSISLTTNPLSGKSRGEFYINLKNNQLPLSNNKKVNYSVFGKIIKGEKFLEKINKVALTKRGFYSNTPSKKIVIKSIKIIADKK